MLRLIQGSGMGSPEPEPVKVSGDSEGPVMTPGLARVFAAIFQRLAAEQRAEAKRRDETAA
jgi:hypothetical protein